MCLLFFTLLAMPCPGSNSASTCCFNYLHQPLQAQEARESLELRVAALEAVVASMQPAAAAAADAPAAAEEVVVAVAEPAS
jgi:hypothetical protein